MRIVFIEPPFSPSREWDRFGFSDLLLGYTSGLSVETGLEIHVVGSYATAPKNPRIQWHLIRANTNDLRNVVTQVMLLRRYAKLIKLLRPAYVHSPDYLSLSLAIDGQPNVPPLLTTPGSISERLNTFNPYDWSYTTALKWARNTLLKHPRTVILATSEYMAKWWRRDGFGRVYTLPLPVTPESMIPQSLARVRLSWKESEIHLLFVASLRSENRVKEMRDFWLRMVSNETRTTDWHLHVIGGGPDRQYFVNMDPPQPIQMEGVVPYTRFVRYSFLLSG